VLFITLDGSSRECLKRSTLNVELCRLVYKVKCCSKWRL